MRTLENIPALFPLRLAALMFYGGVINRLLGGKILEKHLRRDLSPKAQNELVAGAI